MQGKTRAWAQQSRALLQQSKAMAQESKAWAQQSKALVQQSKACAQQSKASRQFCHKMVKNGAGESVFGPHRRKRIAFLSFVVTWCSKPRPGHSKTGPGCHFVEKGVKKGRAKVCLDNTGARGSPFWRSYGNCRKLSEPSRDLHHVGGQSLSKGQDI